MAEEKKYYIGTGNLAAAKLDDAGNPLNFVPLGEAPVFEWAETIEFAENKSTGKEGPNMVDMRIPISRELEIKIVVKEHTKRNLEFLYHGAANTITAGTVADEELPIGFETGNVYFPQKSNVDPATIELTDASATPAPLIEGTNFTVNDTGTITFLDVDAPLIQPFHLAYEYGEATEVKVLSADPEAVCLILDGRNLTPSPDNNLFARVDNIRLSAPTVPLKSGSASGTGNTANEYELSGKAQLGAGKTAADGYGIIRTW